jgi:very-short-patch-repair endonuclease
VIKKYQNCRIDFVVCDSQLSIIALVELDDQINERRRTKDAEQDYITAQAGYKTVRFNRRDWPTVEQVKARIFSDH